jgi:2-C-methyl-D-erythritol 4-phosphate cytidylyltransferase
MASFSVILAAAGKSSRFKDQHYKKPFVPLANKAVWLYSAERFLNRDDVKQLILVIAKEDREAFQMKFGANVAILGVEVVEGGADRCDSVQAALSHVKSDVDFVVVHDAARPCLADEWIDKVFAEAEASGAAILGTPVTSTLKRSTDGKSIEETVPRDRLWEAQTPQVFRREWLLEAYAKRGDANATDDAQLVEQIGHTVSIVPSAISNIKITSRADLRIAELMLKALPKPKLQGPAHPFADDDMWR